uniref:C2 domain-containing protein n=1 Tax=Lepeophtheirus salmonis TaxID=72036 RepID=A0A0K2T164_LEPSM
MMKKGLIKRLSKSASDLSGCRRKSQTNSPEEEQCKSGFQTPPSTGGTDDEDEEILKRPSSSQSHHSKKRSSFKERLKCTRTSSEAAARRTRTVGAELKSQQGFLGLLRQKFGRATSPSRPLKGGEDENGVCDDTEILSTKRSNKDGGREDLPTYSGPIQLPPSQEVEIVQLMGDKDNTSLCSSVNKAQQLRHTNSIGSSTLSPQVSFDNPHHDHFKSHSKFSLRINLKRGIDLAARDSGGTSDPYVKFFYKGKLFYRSKIVYKNLNPYWEEHFTQVIDDPLSPILLKVFDYDFALRDDFIGEASISLIPIELNVDSNFIITLIDPSSTSKNPENLGKVELSIGLTPLSETESLISGDNKSLLDDSIISSNKKATPWSATVNIVLVEGKNLTAMDFEGTSDPYCKFRLGNDRYKSKPIYLTLNPKWMEQFDLTLFQDQSQELEITIWDKDQRTKDDFMGKCTVDLSSLAMEKTHELHLRVDEGSGEIFILLSISGMTNYPGLTSIKNFDSFSLQNEQLIRSSYRFLNSFKDLSDVGFLFIKIYCAKGLYAADLGGKSDPFVVIELDNTRLQTHTSYKTINPVWNRYMKMYIKDIHSVISLNVFDEDRNHKMEFLGRVTIPILQIEDGKKRWYALKDKKCRSLAKGQNPQIQLEIKVTWNWLRAAIVTLNPKEEKYFTITEKFKRQVFLNNVMRIKGFIMEFVNLGVACQNILEWESPFRTILAFIAFTTITYYFQPYHVPIGLLIIFVKNYIAISYLGSRSQLSASHTHTATSDGMDEDEDMDDNDGSSQDKEEKKTLKEKLLAIQEVTAMVQNAIGCVASLVEEIKNTFNFSVPFLSWLAILILVIVVLILYFVSLRFLVICWGINKFSKKLIRPHTVPNNELLDFLSRVPDDEELLDRRELSTVPEEPSARTSAHKKKRN